MDLDRALSDIAGIRSQLASGATFRGFAPAVMAVTAMLALGLALAQATWPEALASDMTALLWGWTGLAMVAAALVGVSAWRRSHRHHGPLAQAMIQGAIQAFLPAGAVGALVAWVLLQAAPDTLWLLPGLWQMLVALGLCAALRSLPGPVFWVAGWYGAAGLVVLMMAAESRAVSPWMMGLPFTVGQGLLALVLHREAGR